MAAVVVKHRGVVVPVTVATAVSVWVETRLMVTKNARPCEKKVYLRKPIEILNTNYRSEIRIKQGQTVHQQR